ncbi:hypothetical protein DPEC_G00228730 [Dallia pectoralis]|uniref:Uncharacterized protein n=1 Tax=Dallia pectoralis TaxID=75939 RepID=A0ACC2G1B6_DALPE|nr:hypothetical protein DPEC_G00228730 [Dallia pectoralis]
MVLIIASYICIIHALFTITLPQDRHKAMKTCTSHLILVSIFYLPINITYLLFTYIPTNVRIINLSLTSVLTPMLNPIIYVLKTEEFKEAAKKLIRSTITRQRDLIPPSVRMSSLTSDPNQTENITTIIRPPYFFISGFTGIPNMKYYYVFLCFVYIISLVGNIFIMTVMYVDRSLHR